MPHNLLYGHVMAHKAESSAPIRKLVVATNEFIGGESVIQFDMPEPDTVAEACGVVVQKQAN
jgi:hypothetical protein